ncbi:hypothetical protein [Rothia sp. (in: high G+C Gram-positive bacteria)]|uniref:hypothetical protein n=1 Tax=Rothia sp. (in: high G+C Gram-positive bacteria) TaxID=1885016 RepID=UPI003217FB1B
MPLPCPKAGRCVAASFPHLTSLWSIKMLAGTSYDGAADSFMDRSLSPGEG